MSYSIHRKKPIEVEVYQFLGDVNNAPDWLKVCGTKLPKKQRVGKFWNKLHDTELEVKYGDYVACQNEHDLYPIKKEVLSRNFDLIFK